MSEVSVDERQRMEYLKVSPEAVRGLRVMEHYLNAESGLGASLLELVRLRVSQTNGCLFCLGLHRHELRQHNEPTSRIDAVERWWETEAFTERERAALRWAEVLTNIQDGHAADAEYATVREHFDDKELVDLTAAVAGINAWNRVAIAFRPQWDEARASRRSGEPAVQATSAGADDGGKVAVDAEP